MISKKERVIEVATRLFAEKGFENTALSVICEEAEVSKGLVYHHFKNKDDLLRAIFAATTARMVEMNEAVDKALPATERIVQLIESLFSQLATDKLFFQFNLNIMMQPGTSSVLSDLIKERSQVFLSSVMVLFKELDPARAEVLSYVLLAELDGVALDYLTVFENYPLEALKDHLITKYRNGNY